MAHSRDQEVKEQPTDTPPTPPISAAFLVTFDNRKGYTIAWQKSLDEIKLDGVVEFKSLPSGLHNVDEDLVYFVHEEFAGISAFLRREDDADDRKARMLAVGCLVSLDVGRMGKSFLYAQTLKDIAKIVADDPNNHEVLHNFWGEHKKVEKEGERYKKSTPEESESPEGYQKPRALSTSTLNTPGYMKTLGPHHPALALPQLLTTFGPLIFPLFRTVLLQKRVLILGEAPVETACNYVYNISVLSSISRHILQALPSFDPSESRTRPLFSVGVSDIATLESLKEPWIACTTDDVLASKPHLFDLLVVLPNSASIPANADRTFPKLVRSTPELVKTFPHYGIRASQRDARRYAALKKALQNLPSGALLSPRRPSDDNSDNDSISTTSSTSTYIVHREAVDPIPWPVIAYTSLIWWASAGDRSGLLEAEELANDQDELLLRECLAADEGGITKEVAIVAYFHKLTDLVFSVLAAASWRSGERYRDEEEGADAEQREGRPLIRKDDEDDSVEVTQDDVRSMGLDVWSEADKQFVSELVEVWLGQKASVQSGSIECCGLRLL